MKIRISALPLYIPYVLFPLFFVVTRNMGYSLSRSWIDAVWIVLGVFAALWIVVTRRLLVERHKFLLVLSSIVFFAAIVAVKFGSSLFGSVVLVPFVMEIKPVIYFAVALLWIGAFGNLNPEHFRNAGICLAVIVFFDLLLESILAGGLIKPSVSGEPNYDACLLLVSFCTWFHGSKNTRGYIIIFIGVLATLSRTALATLVVIMFLFSKGGILKKIAIGAICVLFIIVSFLVRDLPIDSLESMDRFWMWYAGINLLSGDFLQALTGFPSGVALPVDVPKQLEWLWDSQQEGWGIEGIFPFHFHAFWLRFSITWGLATSALMLALMTFIVLDRRKTTFLRSLVFLALLEGLTMGVVYLSNVAVPITLAFFSAAAARGLPSKHDLESFDAA